MKIIPLSEGSFSVGKDKLFHPFDKASDDLQQRSTGSLLVEVQPFCLVTSRDVILIDTGLGFSQNGQPQLYYNLRNNGIEPAAVTKVLMSHLHKDHAGGISYANRLGNHELAFENAVYFVQRREFEDAMDAGFPSYMVDEFSHLDHDTRVFWLDEDEGLIDQYIRFEITAGHSKNHQVFWIEDDGEIAFFGGDDAPQRNQMVSRFVAKYDYDGKKCMELRQKWWEQGKLEGWNFLFYHDIKTPVVKGGEW